MSQSVTSSLFLLYLQFLPELSLCYNWTGHQHTNCSYGSGGKKVNAREHRSNPPWPFGCSTVMRCLSPLCCFLLPRLRQNITHRNAWAYFKALLCALVHHWLSLILLFALGIIKIEFSIHLSSEMLVYRWVRGQLQNLYRAGIQHFAQGHFSRDEVKWTQFPFIFVNISFLLITLPLICCLYFVVWWADCGTPVC